MEDIFDTDTEMDIEPVPEPDPYTEPKRTHGGYRPGSGAKKGSKKKKLKHDPKKAFATKLHPGTIDAIRNEAESMGIPMAQFIELAIDDYCRYKL